MGPGSQRFRTFWGSAGRFCRTFHIAKSLLKEGAAEPQRFCRTLGAKPSFSRPCRFLSERPKRGRKNGTARKLSKSVEKLFDVFWRFLTFCALRENCRKVSKNFWRFLPCSKIVEKCRKTFWHFLTTFDVFWRFLTWPLSASPAFPGPADSSPKNRAHA